jgi:hypothetical protein
MLTIDLAYRLIYIRGISALPVVDNYETEELEKIVLELHELNEKVDRLCERIYEMKHEKDFQ